MKKQDLNSVYTLEKLTSKSGATTYNCSGWNCGCGEDGDCICEIGW